MLRVISAIGASIAGAILLILGTLVSMLQRLLLLQGPVRALSKTEEESLRKIFGDSLALHKVRIIAGRSGLFGLNTRAFTLGNTIYMKSFTATDVLVHECVHVWQYQHFGPRYAIEALTAQYQRGSAAYDWQAEAARGKSDWREFNREAQAQLIQDVWLRGVSTLDEKHSQLVTAALTSLRAKKSMRTSQGETD